MKHFKTFINWLPTIDTPDRVKTFIDWLTPIYDDPIVRNTLKDLEIFVRNHAPDQRRVENIMFCDWRWHVLRALEGCRQACRFHEEGNRWTRARQMVSDFNKDSNELREHLKEALAILRRHYRGQNPVLLGHLFDLNKCLKEKNIFLLDNEPIISLKPFRWRTGHRTPSTVLLDVIQTFYDMLESPPELLDDGGIHTESFGCLLFSSPRTMRHKKPVATSTMLAAYLVTLFDCLRRGEFNTSNQFFPVVIGGIEECTLAANLINAIPLVSDPENPLTAKTVSDRLQKLTSRNSGIKVHMDWH